MIISYFRTSVIGNHRLVKCANIDSQNLSLEEYINSHIGIDNLIRRAALDDFESYELNKVTEIFIKNFNFQKLLPGQSPDEPVFEELLQFKDYL